MEIGLIGPGNMGASTPGRLIGEQQRIVVRILVTPGQAADNMITRLHRG